MYELQHRVKGQESTNSKQMISWNEFYSYFIDYREIEDRNRKLT
jgi:hypothetical protein